MNDLVVKGSILDVSQGGDPVSALMEAKLVILCDRSGSMASNDTNDAARYIIEDKVVSELQGKYSGQIAVVPFNDIAYVSLNGTLPYPTGETNMALALRFVQPIVEAGIRVVLVSDGSPTDSKQQILEIASEMKGFLDTVFIGKEGSEGDKFLKEVAGKAGGSHETNETTRLLEKSLTRLLLKAGGGNS